MANRTFPVDVRYIRSPEVVVGASASKAAIAVVADVPPKPTPSVPVAVMVPDAVIGQPLNDRPVPPPDTST